jgi:hypothetical protein
MTDLHLRILRLIAKRRQSELDDDEAADRTGDPGSAGRRHNLEHAAARTGANAAAAEARRRYPRLAGDR